MDTISWVTVLAQLTMGAGAWRLANQLKVRVDNHETRIGVLEARKRKRK